MYRIWYNNTLFYKIPSEINNYFKLFVPPNPKTQHHSTNRNITVPWQLYADMRVNSAGGRRASKTSMRITADGMRREGDVRLTNSRKVDVERKRAERVRRGALYIMDSCKCRWEIRLLIYG